MNLMNGPKIIGAKPKLTQDQMDVVEVCKETLAQALEGNISSIGIVACMKAGYATVVSGRQAADLNLGCDSLKQKILHKVENAGREKVRQVVQPDFNQ